MQNEWKGSEWRISHFVESVNSKSHIVYYLWTHFVCATIINFCIESLQRASRASKLKRQIIKRGWFWHCSLLLFISELIFCCFFCLFAVLLVFLLHVPFHSTRHSLSFRRLLLVWNMIIVNIKRHQEDILYCYLNCVSTHLSQNVDMHFLMRSIDGWQEQRIILRKIGFYDLS